jgi:HSP20 family protein
MSLIKWDPFRDLEELFEKEHLRVGWDLAVDLYEENGTIVAKMHVPGIDASKIDITIEDDILKVSGSRKKEEETKDKSYYRKEIRSGSFERYVQLPSEVQGSKTMASYQDGVLVITMPKKTPTESKQIKVKVK